MIVLIDLFCGAGGCSMGYKRAGFDRIVGVDIAPQPHYPFEFIQADWESALAILPGLLDRDGDDYVIHASPPCQRYSTMTKKWRREEEHPDLVDPVREVLAVMAALATVIENVPGAPLVQPMMLCGSMFGLGSGSYQLRRHRVFELSLDIDVPTLVCSHRGKSIPVYGHSGGGSTRERRRRSHPASWHQLREDEKFPGLSAWKEAMEIDWMNGDELAEAIPPAYTEFLGKGIIAALARQGYRV